MARSGTDFSLFVAPAKAGVQSGKRGAGCPWVAAFAGMTKKEVGIKRRIRTARTRSFLIEAPPLHRPRA